jgi:hypothetical protein
LKFSSPTKKLSERPPLIQPSLHRPPSTTHKNPAVATKQTTHPPPPWAKQRVKKINSWLDPLIVIMPRLLCLLCFTGILLTLPVISPRFSVSAKEINHFRQDFEKAHADVDKPGISEDEFKEVCFHPMSYL